MVVRGAGSIFLDCRQGLPLLKRNEFARFHVAKKLFAYTAILLNHQGSALALPKMFRLMDLFHWNRDDDHPCNHSRILLMGTKRTRFFEFVLVKDSYLLFVLPFFLG